VIVSVGVDAGVIVIAHVIVIACVVVDPGVISGMVQAGT